MLGWICVVYPAEKTLVVVQRLVCITVWSTQQIGLKYGNSESLVLLFGF